MNSEDADPTGGPYGVQHWLSARNEEEADAAHSIIDSWVSYELGDDGTWIVAARYIPDLHGQLVVAELRIIPNENPADGAMSSSGRASGEWSKSLASVPKGGLRTRDVRKVRLRSDIAPIRSRIISRLADHIERLSGRGTYHFTEADIDAWRAAADAGGSVARGSGRTLPDLQYARLCALYVKAVEAGSARPNVDVARMMGGEWTPVKVREAVRRSRSPQKGLLSPTEPGVPGGTLTPHALALLEGETETEADDGKD